MEKPTYPELTESAASIDASLKDSLSVQTAAAEGLGHIAEELERIGRAAYPVDLRQPRVAGWPWAPGTQAQGFLSGRWERRDGNVYGGALLRAVSGPNSPIRGGDDSQAKVDVPSGARRS